MRGWVSECMAIERARGVSLSDALATSRCFVWVMVGLTEGFGAPTTHAHHWRRHRRHGRAYTSSEPHSSYALYTGLEIAPPYVDRSPHQTERDDHSRDCIALNVTLHIAVAIAIAIALATVVVAII